MKEFATKPSYTSFFTLCKPLLPLFETIQRVGGRPYAVGGSVRDLVLGRQIKDIDIEVHAITLEKLEAALQQHGTVLVVGKKFGVLRVSGYDVDWSLPRKDSKGRKPVVAIDPDMTIQEACRRRDLTMNAMAIDMLFIAKNFQALELQASQSDFDPVTACAIIDPFGGIADIKAKKLRAVDNVLFLDDPLRFFRVIQFISRFEMEPDDELNNICRTMKLFDEQAQTPLANERIYEEMKKLFIKSERPSLGFRWLARLDRLQEIFPELFVLVGAKQRKEFHPEGDVFEHTMQVVDAAAQLPYYTRAVPSRTLPEESINLHGPVPLTPSLGEVQEGKPAPDFDPGACVSEKLLIVLAALCHDLGKPQAFDEVKQHAHGHGELGVAVAKKLLKRLTNDQSLIDAVCNLVKYHSTPHNFLKDNAGPNAYKRLALKMKPVSLRQLAMIAVADKQGRNGAGHEPLLDQFHDVYEQFLQRANDAMVAHAPEPPVLLGRDLLDVVEPGPQLGKLLDMAYDIQIDEGITDKQVLRARVLGLK